jgi:hypothetical protein
MRTFGPTCSRLLKWKTMRSKMQHQREKVAMAGPSSSPHCSLRPTNLRSSYARDDASSLSGRGFDMLGFWLWGGVLTDSNHASWSSETAHFQHFWENLPSIEWIRMTWRHEKNLWSCSLCAECSTNRSPRECCSSYTSSSPASPWLLMAALQAFACHTLHVIGSFWFSDIDIYWSILGLNLPYVK